MEQLTWTFSAESVDGLARRLHREWVQFQPLERDWDELNEDEQDDWRRRTVRGTGE